MKNIYFNGFNGVRFIAVMAVIIHHVEQIKRIYSLPNIYNIPVIKELGGIGVTLFFVLSGFLITYLLIAEKESTSSINIRKFYIRRILRIWPLYFLMVGLTFIVLHNFIEVPGVDKIRGNYSEIILLYVFMLPNVSLIIYPPVPFIAPLWSVGVEEQFYLIWPVLLKIFKNILLLLLSIIILMSLLRFSLFKLSFRIDETWIFRLNKFFDLFRIDCMAIGGLFAYLAYNKKEFCKKYFYPLYVQIVVILLLIVTVGFLYENLYFNQMLAALFALILINVGINQKSLIKLTGKVFNEGGKISYGMYVYHSVISFIVISYASKSITFMHESIFNILVYSIIIIGTILIAWVSYHFFEKRFLVYKRKYTVIRSGEDAKR